MSQFLVQLPPHFGVFLLHVSSFCLLLFSLLHSFVAYLGVVYGNLMQCLIFLVSVCIVPSLFFSPSNILLGSFGLFNANQYLEHLSPSFMNRAWADSFALSNFSYSIIL